MNKGREDNSSGAVAPPIDPAALLALAERCEREDPSRELDAAVTVAKLGDGWTVSAAEGWVCIPHQQIVEAPAYTTRLDAAVTLVPEGWGTHIAVNEDGTGRANLMNPETQQAIWGSRVGGKHSSARALCAAALRARAAVTEAAAAESKLASTARPEGTPISKAHPCDEHDESEASIAIDNTIFGRSNPWD